MNTHLPKAVKKRPALFGLAALLLLGAGGFMLSGSPDAQADAPAGEDAPAQNVDVVKVQTAPVRVWNNFSGRLSAVDHVEIRPRVGGTITEVLFEDGQRVEKGDPLFVIDPRPFEAELSTAKAELASAKSQKDLAYAELERAKKLAENKHMSASVVDARRRDYQVAQAAIQAAEAQLAQAKLDLEYAHITAPVAGQVSRAEITEGNVIEAGANAPVLTTIVSNDRFYAEFDVDEQTYINSVRNLKDDGVMPVEMLLNSGKDVVYKGEVHSFDNRLDVTSGTIRARAIFTNEDGALLPGLFAEIRMGSAGKEKLILVPERAVGTDQDKRYVYVVDGNNKVEYREVHLGKTIDGNREVLSGLDDGDLVLVNSLQRVQPGVEVIPNLPEVAATTEEEDTSEVRVLPAVNVPTSNEPTEMSQLDENEQEAR